MDFNIKKAEHQRPGVLRLDVHVVDEYQTYETVALILPNGWIDMAGKGRVMPPWEPWKRAVREYLGLT